LTLASSDSVTVGAKVVVIGYPGFSPPIYTNTKSQDLSGIHNNLQELAKPTVTDGVVSFIVDPAKSNSAGQLQQGSTMPETYQLTVPTGEGNSGGPVFDAKGNVIGIFTYTSQSRETVTYAIPIKLARKLLQ
jgi:S1-C subfamily serine protease